MNSSQFDPIYTDLTFFKRSPMWNDAESLWKSHQISSFICDNKLSINRLIDYGCGTGSILHILSDFLPGRSYLGFDPCPQLSSQWSSYPNIDFTTTFDLETIDLNDVILLIDVLEHVLDPYSLLDALCSRAGYVIVHLPLELNLSTLLRPCSLKNAYDEVAHLHFYSPATFEIMCTHLRIDVISKTFTFPYRTLKRTRNNKQKLIDLSRSVISSLISPDISQSVLGGNTALYLLSKK